jgi:hypothetical protein
MIVRPSGVRGHSTMIQRRIIMHTPHFPFDPSYAATWDAAQEERRAANPNPYRITRDPSTGLMVATYQGKRIGTSQTEAAARMIIRNHKRREARREH